VIIILIAFPAKAGSDCFIRLLIKKGLQIKHFNCFRHCIQKLLFKFLITMKKIYVPLIFLTLLCLSSCDVIAGIFKAGAVVGIIAVIIVIALIIWIASLFRK